MKETSCTCASCVHACQVSPCWSTASEARALIGAGHGNRLMLGAWQKPGGEKVHVLIPAGVGFEGKSKTTLREMRCTFLTAENRCSLHDAGLKPREAKLTSHAATAADIQELTEMRRDVIVGSWDTPEGRGLIAGWVSTIVPPMPGDGMYDAKRAADLIAAARGLFGVPFKLGGRDPNQGLDCIGLVTAAAAVVGYECPRLMARGEVIGRSRPGRPTFPTPEAIDADLFACLDADLARVRLSATKPGDVVVIKFPANFVAPAWHHAGILATDSAGRWTVIHAAGLHPEKVEERRLLHSSGVQNVLASWDKFIVRVYRLRGAG